MTDSSGPAAQRPQVTGRPPSAKARRRGRTARVVPKSEAVPAGRPVLVSRHQLSALLGCHVDRLSEYRAAGMPLAESPGRGKPNKYNAIECAQWVRRHRPGQALATEARAQLDGLRSEEIRQRMKQRAGLLVEAEQVEIRWATMIAEARTTLLGVPTRLKQRRPDLSAEDLRAVDALIRESLTGLADGGRRGAETP